MKLIKTISTVAAAVLASLGALSSIAGATKVSAKTTYTSTVLTNRRAQEILSQLNYLPLRFAPTGKGATNPYTPESGSFSWRIHLPAATASTWKVAQANPLESAALYSFESTRNLPLTTDLTLPLSAALVSALAKNQRDPEPYRYVYVTTTEPETTYVYANRTLVYHTLANTGVSSAPTQLGTFYIYVRYLTTTMSGTYPWGGSYYDPNLPYVSYFNGGDGLHGFIRASYGWPQSLGCVEMPYANAHVVFEHTAIGTPVTVAVARP